MDYCCKQDEAFAIINLNCLFKVTFNQLLHSISVLRRKRESRKNALFLYMLQFSRYNRAHRLPVVVIVESYKIQDGHPPFVLATRRETENRVQPNLGLGEQNGICFRKRPCPNRRIWIVPILWQMCRTAQSWVCPFEGFRSLFLWYFLMKMRSIFGREQYSFYRDDAQKYRTY